jgi:glutathione S-transferase
MILYHYPTSPFARRVRLAMAWKGSSAELRDARGNPEHAAKLRELNPLHTVPLLIDGERQIADSGVICQYLDRKHPEPALFPAGLTGAEAFAWIALADAAITTLVDAGMRYFPLRDSAHFERVREQMIGRAQRALDALAARVTTHDGGPLCGDRWSAADIALYTTVYWLETMPARVASFPPAGQMLGLGWSLPVELSRWADQHRQRADVLALD